jgi:hypothetical protein
MAKGAIKHGNILMSLTEVVNCEINRRNAEQGSVKGSAAGDIGEAASDNAGGRVEISEEVHK